MKRTVLPVLLCLIGIYSHSQFVIFGVKGGLNLTTFTSNYVEDRQLRPSFHGGVLANFLINDKIMLQPEVLYSGKGSKYKNGSYHFGYINVPVLGQYRMPSGFFVEAGPQVGFIVSARRKTDGQSTLELKDKIKSTDFSWVFGLGYKTASGFGGAARYDFGYYNISKGGTIKNKVIMISLFYTFDFFGD